MPFEAQVLELQSGVPLVAVSVYLQINSIMHPTASAA